MEKDLQTLLYITLKEHEEIKFDVYFEMKGCIVAIEIGEKQNEDCGPIFKLLEQWLGYDEFIEYLISKDVQNNFEGIFFINEDEIFMNIILKRNFFEYAESHTINSIIFEEDFITNELKIDLSTIRIENGFEEENWIVQFNKLKDTPIKNLELSYYSDDWHTIELDENQLNKLSQFIDSELEQSLPEFNGNFDCELIWEAECIENEINYDYWCTPILLKLNDIIAQ
jgi:hypothetical protein